MIKGIIILTTQIFTSVESYSVKCVSCFMLRHLMTSWHLNIWKLKIWLSQKLKELSKWNKKHFSLLHKCSHLDLKDTLAKMWRTKLNLLWSVRAAVPDNSYRHLNTLRRDFMNLFEKNKCITLKLTNFNKLSNMVALWQSLLG